MIYRYSQFVNESSSIKNIDSSFYEKMSLLENEYLKMKESGLSEEKINENIFSSILGSLGGGFTDTFKDYVIDWAAEKLGIEPIDEETGEMTFFYQLVRNVIENVSITDLGGYFGKGSCTKWAKAIVKAFAETLEERGIDYILPKLGLKIDSINTGFGGTIAASMREALTNYVNDTTFMTKIEKSISDKICGFSFGDVLSGNISSEDKKKLSTEVERAESKDPNIFSKAMKTGLSNILSF